MKHLIISTLLILTNIVSAQSFLIGIGGGVSEELHVFQGGPKESIDKGTINIDMGITTKQNTLLTLNIGIHQSEPTPEQYSITGNSFGDPRSGSYTQNNVFTVGGGMRVIKIKGVEVFGLVEVGSLTKMWFPIYKDPMGILGGGDNRYITRTGEKENHMVMGGGMMISYDHKYIKLTATDKSANVCVGIML